MNGKGHIEITIQSKADFLIIEIQDSGKGISKNNYKRIFDPGFTPKQRGWGLRPFIVQTNYRRLSPRQIICKIVKYTRQHILHFTA